MSVLSHTIKVLGIRRVINRLRFVEVTKGQVTNQIMSHPVTAENEVKTNPSQTTVLVEVGLCKIHLPQQMIIPLIATAMKGGEGDV